MEGPVEPILKCSRLFAFEQTPPFPLGASKYKACPSNDGHALRSFQDTIYFANLETLWLERLADQNPDLAPSRQCFRMLSKLHYLKTHIGNAWENKLGVMPFTRAALNDKKVRHEIVLNEDGKADENIDPQSKYLEELRILNNTCCDILNVAGYDGELLCVNIPWFDITKRQQNTTNARTKEQQDAIAARGSIFLKAVGRTLNDDAYFIAKERTQRVESVKELRSQANIRIQAEKRAAAAHAIMEKKLPSKYSIIDLKALIAWRTGKPCPSKVKRKN
eukprot:scaffold55409_cov48-Attheya_sp.AAC.4